MRFPARARRPILRVLLLVAAACVLYALRRPEEEDPAGSRARRSAGSPDRPAEIPIASGLVSAVLDGDSIVLEGGIQVRYLGIDAPERDEPFAEEARTANRDLVLGREVMLEPGGPEPLDAYGRVLAVVLAPLGADGGRICVNAELVRRGLAWIYLKGTDGLDLDFLDAIRRAQEESIEAGRGLWPGRLEAAGRVGAPLVATRLRIHRAGCETLGDARVSPVTDIRKEFGKGKSLCRSCRPLDGR